VAFVKPNCEKQVTGIHNRGFRLDYGRTKALHLTASADWPGTELTREGVAEMRGETWG
jgi:hypothetical protein